ncbi:MAG: hypothetical protein J0L92_29295 [Deltaproteobacteria bacterium]|nr:hypothetical protein [Deltaproteobacteria bacterium]
MTSRALTAVDLADLREMLRDVVREELAAQRVPANEAPRSRRRRRGDPPTRVASAEMIERVTAKMRNR